MSDIFEIKGIDAEFVVKGQTYKFCDPLFKDKVLLRKGLKALEAAKSTMDEDDYALALFEITKKMIKQYLPDISDAVLDTLGEGYTTELINQLQLLATKKFGSVVEKAEGKSEATV